MLAKCLFWHYIRCIMKIKRFFVSGYKNLSKCEIHPKGFHAITGCNSCGKSNFLEVLPFIAAFFTAHGENRKSLIEKGISPNGMAWIPVVRNPEDLEPFRFEIDVESVIENENWLISYVLEFEKPKRIADSPYSSKGPSKIILEKVSIKQLNKPGPKRIVLDRDLNGVTSIRPEREPRNKFKFKTKMDSSALQTLEVREANDFVINFPILSVFYLFMCRNGVFRIDPLKLIEGGTEQNPLTKLVVDSFDLVDAFKKIEDDDQTREEFLFWAKRLCNIENVTINESKRKDLKFLFIEQNDILHTTYELSMGTAFVLGILLALFSLRPFWGPIVIEEPESHIHPKAIVDLISLLRSISEEITVIISTHSPVVINSLNPEEVSLIKPIGNGLVTTKDISESKEAIDALNRGYMSFGDLLQNSFLEDD
jgi:AAA15 family ATPase/GTPase